EACGPTRRCGSAPPPLLARTPRPEPLRRTPAHPSISCAKTTFGRPCGPENGCAWRPARSSRRRLANWAKLIKSSFWTSLGRLDHPDFRMLRSGVFFETPMRRTVGLPGAVLLVVAAAACSGNPRPQVAAAPPVDNAPPPAAEAAAPQAPQVPVDPVAELIAESDRLFTLGKHELELGHLTQAREAFDRAVDVLLEAPGGARQDERLRVHFDRLVDRIAAQEALALQTGDGFTEKPSEPAVIDELLEVATFAPDTPPDKDVEAAVQADLASAVPDIPIPLNDRVLHYVELFQGRLRDHL